MFLKNSLLIFLLIINIFAGYSKDFSSSGNKYASGSFDLSKSTYLKAELNHIPLRVYADHSSTHPTVYSTSEDGIVYKTVFRPNGVFTVESGFLRSPIARLDINPQPNDISPISAPVITKYGMSYVTMFGSLMMDGKRFDINATDDNEISVLDKYMVVLKNPSDDYAHGVLGNWEESRGITVFDIDEKKVLFNRDLCSIGYVEQKGAMIADLNGDKEPEVLLTLSNTQTGAHVHVVSLRGGFRYDSDGMGEAYKWRHVIGAAEFEDGVLRVVNVLHPHVGGVLEFLEPTKDGKLISRAKAKYVSSHSVGSSNLDMAMIMDTDGDSVPEVIVPDMTKTTLKIFKNNRENAVHVNSIKFDGKLSSDIKVALKRDEISMFTFGTDSKELHLFVVD